MIWNTSLSPDRQTRFDRLGFVSLVVVLSMLLASVSATGTLVFGEGVAVLSERQVAEDAIAAWDRGATLPALELLDQGIRDHPQASILHKLRGDILATFRGPQEAVQAYDRVLAERPATLDARWAKWSVLVWWGQAEEALAELRRIAQLDSLNPLIHLKLAQELRKVDRLEESLESHEQAVRMMPRLLGWRLALARARFDLLDYQGAEEELRSVLQQLAPGSPLEIPAKNQLAQLYESMERGRRFTPLLTPGATSSQLREWAAIRADGGPLPQLRRRRAGCQQGGKPPSTLHGFIELGQLILCRNFKRRARRELLQDRPQLLLRALIIQEVKPGTGQSQSPPKQARHHSDGLFMGLQRFLQTIDLPKFLGQFQMNQGIQAVELGDAAQLGKSLLRLPPPHQDAPLGPAGIQRRRSFGEDTVVRLHRFLRTSERGENVTSQFVQYGRLRMVPNSLIEQFERGECCPPIPGCYGVFGHLPLRENSHTLSKYESACRRYRREQHAENHDQRNESQPVETCLPIR